MFFAGLEVVQYLLLPELFPLDDCCFLLQLLPLAQHSEAAAQVGLAHCRLASAVESEFAVDLIGLGPEGSQLALELLFLSPQLTLSCVLALQF